MYSLHVVAHRVEELGRLRRVHDVGDTALEVEVGGPAPFDVVAEDHARVADRSCVSAREGVDGGVDAQAELVPFVDEGLEVVPRGGAFHPLVAAREPCAEPCHLIGRRRAEEHVARRGTYVDHDVGEAGLFGFGQIAGDIFAAVGEVGEVGGRIHPDEAGLLRRGPVGILRIGPLPFGIFAVGAARDDAPGEEEQRAGGQQCQEGVFHGCRRFFVVFWHLHPRSGGCRQRGYCAMQSNCSARMNPVLPPIQ